jgi:hypothetical protein
VAARGRLWRPAGVRRGGGGGGARGRGACISDVLRVRQTTKVYL